jgi:signal transduction histidine kinase
VPEAHDIFKRFGKVFEQTYTRFLDLQKAEAQAREAQIEAALEKVRSRSLAMHKSDELQAVVHTLFERLNELNFELDTAIIIIFKEGSKDTVWWLQNSANQQYLKIAVPYADLFYLRNLFEGKENKEDLPSGYYSLEQKNELLNYLFDHTDFRFTPQEQKKSLLQKECATMSAAIAKNTAIHITRYFKKDFSVKESEILKKFSNVFDQAYTRFLDLQRAEASARESQIEAALERVRSKAMAMHKADDLNPAVAIVFEELDKLNLGMLRCGIGIITKEKRSVEVWTTSVSDAGSTVQLSGAESMDIHPLLQGAFNAWVKRTDFSYTLQGDDLLQYYKAVGETNIRLPQSQTEVLTQYYHVTPFDAGSLFAFRETEFTDEGKAVMKRFANVFNLTYKRFLDLQKAEAQAREGQIQLALERVRARTMAMQHSNEHTDAAMLMFKQLEELGVNAFACGFVILDKNETEGEFWMSSEGVFQPPHYIPHMEEPSVRNMYMHWKNGEESYAEDVGGEALKSHYKYLMSLPKSGSNFQGLLDAGITFPEWQRMYAAYFSHGYLLIITKEQYKEEAIFNRFAKVFEQTYTRFLDLQKAEAQARESQIQLALERVRARTMAMQHSDDLGEAASLLFKQVSDLGVQTWTSGFNIWQSDDKSFIGYNPTPSGDIADAYIIPSTEDNFFKKIYQAKKEGIDFIVFEWKGKPLADTYLYMKTLPVVKDVLNGIEDSGFQLPTFQINHCVFFAQGFLLFITLEPYPEAHDIFKRFGKVFEQTYTRFLDLQKAEAQAREAEIELALERVRARTMAMQKHDDLIGVINTLAEQLLQLGFDLQVANFSNGISDSDWDLWLFGMFDNGVSFTKRAVFPWFDHPFFHRVHAALDLYRKGGSDLSVEVFNKEEKDSWLDHTFSNTEFKDTPMELREGAYKAPGYCWSSIILKETWVAIGKYDTKPFTQEENNILRKFATAFDQAYTRFLDLQKAEAQARQAKIEAAMEKVRSRAMAMQKPAELVEVAKLLREEMGLLGVEELETSSIYIHNETTQQTECWYAIQKDGKLVSDHMTIELKDTWVGREMLKFYQSGQKETSIVMQGEPRKEWINYCAGHSTALVGFYGDVIPDRTYHLYKFSNGYMGAASPGAISSESWDLLQRATSVFSLAYTRFSDLQLAEAQAREAQIETALERVRSRTLAMQKSDELAEAATVLFRQLILLGIEPKRLFISIVKDESGESEFWVTDEVGNKLSTAYTANLNDNPSFKKMYEGWKQERKSIMIDMQGWELEDFFKHLSSLKVPFKRDPSQKRRLEYIAYFARGFIGMASPEEQPLEAMQLLERFAAVFNLTFTRFNDLKIAEAHALKAEQDLIEIKAARKHAEDSLVELQAAQRQLVQSEKMASLGELTAGIAHEIQNPLNFVNNFSDVSNELLEEMKTELEKGNTKDAASIVEDVKQNLEKILYHGKRADSIVKGMLQHSRTSAGQKELTDINALADEYLRLAYHGLRAKDKSFNAKFITDFDNSVGKISIIPQEIGRVILNLINNAFYTVAERQKVEGERRKEEEQTLNHTPSTSRLNYEPTVSVSTKKVDDKLLITIADNGNGIPQKNLDKIFQPFFTTKPTGQGTGLGLSLAYDIVTKGHNGEIKIETREGEGSKFIVIIPST